MNNLIYIAGQLHGNYGKKFSVIHKQNLSKSLKGKNKGKPTWNKGLKGYPEGKQNGFYGKKHTEKTKSKIRKARMNQIIPRKDTKPELLLQSSLQIERIKFTKHIPILGQPDIFIKPNICVFVDGDYWHTIPKVKKRDIFVTDNLEKEGYIVLRFWEHEIYNNIKNVINGIVGEIND